MRFTMACICFTVELFKIGRFTVPRPNVEFIHFTVKNRDFIRFTVANNCFTVEFLRVICFTVLGAQFLYKKETKSSYEIEKEVPSEDRVDKFVTLLVKAGTANNAGIVREDRLVHLQGAIVDSRFAVKSFRDFQNYIGQTHPDFHQQIHYICPPPAYVSSLMTGLQQMAVLTEGINPVVRAAIISFGFVFIHPFEDGMVGYIVF